MQVKFKGQDCELKVETYRTTGRQALMLYDARDGGYVALATANFGDVPLKPNEVLIKDHDENAGMLKALETAGAVRFQGGHCKSGLDMFPVCELLVTERHHTEIDPLLRKAMEEMKDWMGGRANGIPYAELDRDGKLELLHVGMDWNPYIEEGLEVHQIDQITENAVDGKPPERWLEGVKFFAVPVPETRERSAKEPERASSLVEQSKAQGAQLRQAEAARDQSRHREQDHGRG